MHRTPLALTGLTLATALALAGCGTDAESVWAPDEAVARARAAADHLLEHSRHALDAANPATRRWRDVDAGSRLAVRLAAEGARVVLTDVQGDLGRATAAEIPGVQQMRIIGAG